MCVCACVSVLYVCSVEYALELYTFKHHSVSYAAPLSGILCLMKFDPFNQPLHLKPLWRPTCLKPTISSSKLSIPSNLLLLWHVSAGVLLYGSVCVCVCVCVYVCVWNVGLAVWLLVVWIAYTHCCCQFYCLWYLSMGVSIWFLCCSPKLLFLCEKLMLHRCFCSIVITDCLHPGFSLQPVQQQLHHRCGAGHDHRCGSHTVLWWRDGPDCTLQLKRFAVPLCRCRCLHQHPQTSECPILNEWMNDVVSYARKKKFHSRVCLCTAQGLGRKKSAFF